MSLNVRSAKAQHGDSVGGPDDVTAVDNSFSNDSDSPRSTHVAVVGGSS